MTVSIKSTIFSQFQQLRPSSKPALPPLTDDLVLLDSGVDSLGIAILVTRLEDELGFDPFTDSESISPPVTLGEFVRIYEHAAKLS